MAFSRLTEETKVVRIVGYRCDECGEVLARDYECTSHELKHKSMDVKAVSLECMPDNEEWYNFMLFVPSVEQGKAYLHMRGEASQLNSWDGPGWYAFARRREYRSGDYDTWAVLRKPEELLKWLLEQRYALDRAHEEIEVALYGPRQEDLG